MAKDKITAVKGMNDILPQDDPLWDFYLNAVRRVVRHYGYMQIRTPILEQTCLFKRGIGEVTDIVEKEMYSFVDSLNGEELTLRPENTASVVRASIEHNLIYEAPKRLWYFGPMFRHERPQRGRYRQFYQVGVEALGFKGPDVDVEQLLMVARLWKILGVDKEVRLELNCLGQGEERLKYRQALIEYFEAHAEQLDEDAKRRLYSNPLRILDTKNPDMQELVTAAPKLLDYLGEDSLTFLRNLESLLKDNNIPYVINPRLVRGLDYYNLTVYEWVTDKLGSQATVCGGGRYDPLIEMLGGRSAPACGFAMGVERVLELMKECDVTVPYKEAKVYLCWQGTQVYEYALRVAEKLRDSEIDVIVHAGSAKFANQMKRANTSGADYAVIIGSDEMENGKLSVKPLRENLADYGQQKELTVEEAVEYLNGTK